MAVEDKAQPIKIQFGERFSSFFDEMLNCDLSNRKSDGGYIELNKPMLRPRPGTDRIGNELITTYSNSTAYVIGDVVIESGLTYRCKSNHTNQPVTNPTYWETFSGGTSKQFFYVDRKGVNRHIRAFNNNLYYLNAGVWTFIKAIGTTDIEFSTQRVPISNVLPWSSSTTYVINDKVLLSGVVYRCILGHTNQTPPNATYWVVSNYDSVEYTSTTGASGAEKVVKAAGDTLNTNNNIGKVCMITNGIYKGCYASIIAWSGTEYTLSGAGIITALPANTTYKIFDFVSEALMICRGSSNQEEIFFDGIIELSHFQGYSTASLRQVAALSSTETIIKMINFQNQCWTFKGGTLYYTGGFPGNPFFFNFTTQLTVGGNGTINDIYTYKTRIVINGSNFLYSLPATLIIDRHINSYGAIKDAYINTGEDVYIFTSQKTLVSLSETIAGVIQIKNVGDAINNYLSTFDTKISCGTDSKKIYIYGQPSPSIGGYMCVLDITQKQWLIWSGLQPSSILASGGVTYLTDNNSDIVRKFNSNTINDIDIGTSVTKTFEQKLTIKEVDADNIFTLKVFEGIEISFENFNQSVYADALVAINSVNGAKKRATFNITQVKTGDSTLSEGIISENLFGGIEMLSTISVPILKKASFANDPVNIFKLIVGGLEGSPFYINQINLLVSQYGAPGVYFDPNATK